MKEIKRLFSFALRQIMLYRKETIMVMILLSFFYLRFFLCLPIETAKMQVQYISLIALFTYFITIEVSFVDGMKLTQYPFLVITLVIAVAFLNPIILMPLACIWIYLGFSFKGLGDYVDEIEEMNENGSEMDREEQDLLNMKPPSISHIPHGTPIMVIGLNGNRDEQIDKLLSDSRAMEITSISEHLLNNLSIINSLQSGNPHRQKAIEGAKQLVEDMEKLRSNSHSVIDDLEIQQRAGKILAMIS